MEMIPQRLSSLGNKKHGFFLAHSRGSLALREASFHVVSVADGEGAQTLGGHEQRIGLTTQIL